MNNAALANWKSWIQNLGKNKVKILVALGLTGIALLFLSEIFAGSTTVPKAPCRPTGR